MKNIFKRTSQKAPRPLTIAVVIALVVGAWLLRQYFSLIVSAMIVAFLFSPVYRWLQTKTNSDGAAAGITLLITIVAIIIPLVLILIITVNSASNIISDVSNAVNTAQVNDYPTKILNSINSFLSSLTGRNIEITFDQVLDYLGTYISQIAEYFLDFIKNMVGSIGSFVTAIILYMYIFTAVLVHQNRIINMFNSLNPLGKDISELYMFRAGAMTKAMVKGQFTIAIIQGTVSALVLWLVGVPYFSFFLLLLTFLSVIPLGAGIVTIPIGIGMILFGNIPQGVIVLLNHFLVVTNIDNILKPILVPKSVRLQPALLLLSVFAGIGLFGFLGIIIGPVLMILIKSTIDIYLATTAAETEVLEKASS